MPDTRLPLGPAARLLGVSPGYLSRLAAQGKVPTEAAPGGRRLFAVRELELLRRQLGLRGKARQEAREGKPC